jgi:hypothetical protein
LISDHLRWVVPRETPNGSYQLILIAGNTEIALAVVEIAGVARAYDPPPVQHRSNARFGTGLELRGYTLETNQGILSLSLVWHVSEVVSDDYKVFIHLVDDVGAIIEQRDAMPLDNAYPTSLWLMGEFIEDNYAFQIPDQPYSIRVGFYMPETGDRLPVSVGGEEQSNGYLVIIP